MESRVRGGGEEGEDRKHLYGDIIFIIILELYFAYPFQFNVNHINPAILSNISSQFVDKKIIKIEHFLY